MGQDKVDGLTAVDIRVLIPPSSQARFNQASSADSHPRLVEPTGGQGGQPQRAAFPHLCPQVPSGLVVEVEHLIKLSAEDRQRNESSVSELAVEMAELRMEVERSRIASQAQLQHSEAKTMAVLQENAKLEQQCREHRAVAISETAEVNKLRSTMPREAWRSQHTSVTPWDNSSDATSDIYTSGGLSAPDLHHQTQFAEFQRQNTLLRHQMVKQAKECFEETQHRSAELAESQEQARELAAELLQLQEKSLEERQLGIQNVQTMQAVTAELKHEVQQVRAQALQDMQQCQGQVAASYRENMYLRSQLHQQELAASSKEEAPPAEDTCRCSSVDRLSRQLAQCEHAAAEEVQQSRRELAQAQQQISQLREQLVQQRVAIARAQHDAGEMTSLRTEALELAAEAERCRRATVEGAQCAALQASASRQEIFELMHEVRRVQVAAQEEVQQNETSAAAARAELCAIRSDQQTASLAQEADEAAKHEAAIQHLRNELGEVPPAATEELHRLSEELGWMRELHKVTEEEQLHARSEHSEAKQESAELVAAVARLRLMSREQAQHSEWSNFAAREETLKLEEEVCAQSYELALQGQHFADLEASMQGQRQRMKLATRAAAEEAQSCKEARTEASELRLELAQLRASSAQEMEVSEHLAEQLYKAMGAEHRAECESAEAFEQVQCAKLFEVHAQEELTTLREELEKAKFEAGLAAAAILGPPPSRPPRKSRASMGSSSLASPPSAHCSSSPGFWAFSGDATPSPQSTPTLLPRTPPVAATPPTCFMAAPQYAAVATTAAAEEASPQVSLVHWGSRTSAML